MRTGEKPYILKDYGKSSTFASFLPGISGLHGIPMWCCYVNRGQGVVSFGIENKDHAIMEFYPAHQAYQNVKRTGFRTFIKKEGEYFEPFQKEQYEHRMSITMNGLAVQEKNDKYQTETNVSYYTLPGENLGALIRKVCVKNTGDTESRYEVLDGMPACIPYGVDMNSIKSMGQTVKAWMQAEELPENVSYFRVRASTTDTADVTEVKGGNFSFSCLEDGSRLYPIVDPEAVFSYDTSLSYAAGFMELGVSGLHSVRQVRQNQFPCSFYGTEKRLKPGEEIVCYQIIGQVENQEILYQFLEKNIDGAYFEKKRSEAETLTEEICENIATKTASEEFDEYCRHTYLDNVLRGGYPIILGEDKVCYVYSRKHGDLERDYNYFSMSPEYYSQGNGNFRDVNQNRRCDTFFSPAAGRENIRMFYSLIQMDGYNPLAVEQTTYTVPEEGAREMIREISSDAKLEEFLKAKFTPGSLYRILESMELTEEKKTDLFHTVMTASKGKVNASFKEGYWSDHWTYNLDLIEDYLEIYPEQERELLLEAEYTYFVSRKNINRRMQRYVKTEKGIRQYHALDEERKQKAADKMLRAKYGQGEEIKSTLLEKLILLCTLKFTTLDAYGMGVEMEGGKPGWYDALNGMPGLFGSSMAETYELSRNLQYTIKALETIWGSCSGRDDSLEILEDLFVLIERTQKAVKEEWEILQKEQEVLTFWNKINDAKECYREKTFDGISGKRTPVVIADLRKTLKDWLTVVEIGIRKACRMEDGICPTYMTYEMTSFRETKEGIEPLHFEPVRVPLFLEGPVRFLKLGRSGEEKRKLYHKVKESDLYDRKLSMYKVNASLSDASYELGRSKAFTPGWLENESIWLHMEYKYLLELLKSGLYEEFNEDFYHAAIPFLDPKVYGRSIYENSSFLASSKNPDERCHGKGFVARLSGSTIEFIQMWKWMMFGKNPFELREGSLVFSLKPFIPEYLTEEKRRVEAMFMGNCKVIYQLDKKAAYIPGNYRIAEMNIVYKDGKILKTNQDIVTGKPAQEIRSGCVKEIQAVLEILK